MSYIPQIIHLCLSFYHLFLYPPSVHYCRSFCIVRFCRNLTVVFTASLFPYFHFSLPIILSLNLYISLLILEVLYQIVELFSVSSIPRPLPPTLPLSLFLFHFPLPLYGICFTFLFYTIFHFSSVSTTAPKPPNGSHPTLKPVRSRVLYIDFFCLISFTFCMSSIFLNIQDPLRLDAIVFCLFLCRCLYNLSSAYQCA